MCKTRQNTREFHLYCWDHICKVNEWFSVDGFNPDFRVSTQIMVCNHCITKCKMFPACGVVRCGAVRCAFNGPLGYFSHDSKSSESWKHPDLYFNNLVAEKVKTQKTYDSSMVLESERKPYCQQLILNYWDKKSSVWNVCKPLSSHNNFWITKF